MYGIYRYWTFDQTDLKHLMCNPLGHAIKTKTIAHKQNVEEYVYFETIVQIGQEEYLIELAAERVKGQDKNLLDLYNVHVKRNPAVMHLSTFPQGFSKDSITDKNGKIKAYFINFEGELKHTTNSEGKPIGKSFAEVYNFYRWFGDSKAVDEQGRPLVGRERLLAASWAVQLRNNIKKEELFLRQTIKI